MLGNRIRAGVGLAVMSAALAIGAAGAPSAGSDPPPPTHATVSMKDFAFNPATITIAAGGTVTWTYDESAADPQPNCESPYFRQDLPVNCPGHSATAVDTGPDGKPVWDSGVHRADGFPWSHRFTTPGTYHYYCTVHGGQHPNNPITHMDGVVVVEAASAAASPPQATTGPAAPSGAPRVLAVSGTRPAPLPNTGPPPGLALAGALLAWAGLVVRRYALAVEARGTAKKGHQPDDVGFARSRGRPRPVEQPVGGEERRHHAGRGVGRARGRRAGRPH